MTSYIFFKLKSSISLLETTIVLTIMAVSIGIAIPTITYIKNTTITISDDIKLKNIQSALQEYFLVNKCLPKPALITIPRNNVNYGKEKTSPDDIDISIDSDFHQQGTNGSNKHVNVEYVIYRGMIPFKDLSLNESDIIDGNGNFFEYYVPEIMTLKNEQSPNKYADDHFLYKKGYKKTMENSYPCVSKKNNNQLSVCDLKNVYNGYGVYFIDDLRDWIPADDINPDKTQYFCFKSNSNYHVHSKIATAKVKISGVTNYKVFIRSYGEPSCDFVRLYNIDSTYNIVLNTEYQNSPGNNINDYLSYTFSNISANNIHTILFDYTKNHSAHVGDDRGYVLLQKNGFLSIEQNEEVEYIQQPYGIRIRDIEIEKQTIQYNEDEHIYLPNPTNAYVDNNGSIAYIIISHGKNGEKTCAIKAPINDTLAPTMISKLTNCAKIGQDSSEQDSITDQTLNNCTGTLTSRYEAQNCFDVEENATLFLIGRNKFLDGKNHELVFYQGKQTQNFDDVIVYSTIDELLHKK